MATLSQSKKMTESPGAQRWDVVLVKHFLDIALALDEDVSAWRGLCGANRAWRNAMAKHWRPLIVRDFSLDMISHLYTSDCRICLWWHKDLRDHKPLLATLPDLALLHLTLCIDSYAEYKSKGTQACRDYVEELLTKPEHPFGALLVIIERDLQYRKARRDRVRARGKQERLHGEWCEAYDEANEASERERETKQQRVSAAKAVGLSRGWTASEEMYSSSGDDSSGSGSGD